MRKIRIRFKKDGQVTMQVEGGTDETCLDLTKALEHAVGEVEHRVMCEDIETDPLQVRERVEEREEVSEF